MRAEPVGPLERHSWLACLACLPSPCVHLPTCAPMCAGGTAVAQSSAQAFSDGGLAIARAAATAFAAGDGSAAVALAQVGIGLRSIADLGWQDAMYHTLVLTACAECPANASLKTQMPANSAGPHTNITRPPPPYTHRPLLPPRQAVWPSPTAWPPPCPSVAPLPLRTARLWLRPLPPIPPRSALHLPLPTPPPSPLARERLPPLSPTHWRCATERARPSTSVGTSGPCPLPKPNTSKSAAYLLA